MALHTDRKYEEQLAHLRQLILEMGGLVERQIGDATASLASADRALAEQTIERDHQVNRYDVDIDEECLRLLALHQPAARDLRLITTSLKITTDLERIGDMAVNISERAIDLCDKPAALQLDLPRMADTVRKMLRESLDAFVREPRADERVGLGSLGVAAREVVLALQRSVAQVDRHRARFSVEDETAELLLPSDHLRDEHRRLLVVFGREVGAAIDI